MSPLSKGTVSPPDLPHCPSTRHTLLPTRPGIEGRAASADVAQIDVSIANDHCNIPLVTWWMDFCLQRLSTVVRHVDLLIVNKFCS